MSSLNPESENLRMILKSDWVLNAFLRCSFAQLGLWRFIEVLFGHSNNLLTPWALLLILTSFSFILLHSAKSFPSLSACFFFFKASQLHSSTLTPFSLSFSSSRRSFCFCSGRGFALSSGCRDSSRARLPPPHPLATMPWSPLRPTLSTSITWVPSLPGSICRKSLLPSRAYFSSPLPPPLLPHPPWEG